MLGRRERATQHLDDVVRLVAVETDRLDVFLQAILAEVKKRLGRIRDRVKLGGRLVHADVGSLRRQDDGNQ